MTLELTDLQYTKLKRSLMIYMGAISLLLTEKMGVPDEKLPEQPLFKEVAEVIKFVSQDSGMSFEDVMDINKIMESWQEE